MPTRLPPSLDGAPPASGARREAGRNLGVEKPRRARVADGGFVEVPAKTADVGRADHRTDRIRPLAGAADVPRQEALPWPDLGDPQRTAPLTRRTADIQIPGWVGTPGLQCPVFESASLDRSPQLSVQSRFRPIRLV